ncbi:PIN domain-containing protein [Endozoicomonas sp. GU-1]|uniref:PIN domain-containing protein n=1 Tax=unclassified Endozoicomonas TaxID=2644528 RepID=UPI0022B5A268|nr:type II toxin-antitoxin system VapC family toxin [Endozoicomonas sp. GU-1]WBA82877.1 type II toxin-antitoxin system VapC family toxin [Endozoicomonas sp. GU-1]WBA85805.1 type II toxin-antitoxin system VapC family toxin [Endozoicomonas sp. GU-1]
MDGIDTNILIRYLVRDDEPQYQQVLNFLTGCQKFYISPLVLIETVWVLSHFYRVDPEQQCQKLRAVLHLQKCVTDHCPETLKALDDYQQGYDFADAMIGHHNKQQCVTTLTFDRKASRLPEFSLLWPQ